MDIQLNSVITITVSKIMVINSVITIRDTKITVIMN